MIVALRRGEVTASSTTLTVHDAVAGWVVAARKGTVRTRGRKPFAEGTIRSVKQNLPGYASRSGSAVGASTA